MSIALLGSKVQATSAKMNEIIGAVNDNTDRSTAAKELAYNEITTASAAFTSIADVTGLSIGFTLTAARTVNIEVFGILQSTVSGDRVQLTLTDAANTVLQVTGDLAVPANSASVEGYIKYRKQLPAGSYTFKVRANRQAGGSGTCIVNAAATRPAFIQALDVT